MTTIETPRPISEDEAALMIHIMMWGSDGYPVKKLGRGWTWSYRGIAGPPVVFKTKKAAVESFEAFMDVLKGAKAEEVKGRAIAAQREN